MTSDIEVLLRESGFCRAGSGGNGQLDRFSRFARGLLVVHLKTDDWWELHDLAEQREESTEYATAFGRGADSLLSVLNCHLEG
jgi:hypothetical protein